MPLSHLSGYFGTRGRSKESTSVSEMMSSTGRGPYPIQPLMTIEEINKKRGAMGLALLPTAPTGLPTMPMLGSMDGGGAGNGGGGGQIRYGDSRPSFGGLQHQAPFSASPDGSTVASVSAAAGNGLGDFYGGQSASGGPPRPMLTSWGDEMPNFAPRKAYGGMLQPGQPFIAGDAQKDGKANPELILPGPNGTHVIPLKGKGKKGKGLPMLAYGTSVTRSVEPGQEDMLELLPNPYGTGFSTGAIPPQAAPVIQPPLLASPVAQPGDWTAKQLEQVATQESNQGNLPMPVYNRGLEMLKAGSGDPSVLEQVRAGFSRSFRDTAAAQAEAQRQKAMNPQGIEVGVTPRAPLTAFARPTLTPQQIADADYDRYERITRREAMRNPQLAAAMLAGRSAADQKRLDREARERVVGIQQGGADRRSTAGITAADARAEATNQIRMDENAVANNKWLAGETRLQNKDIQAQQPITTLPAAGNPEEYVDRYRGNTYLGTLRKNGEPVLSARTIQGSNVGVALLGKDRIPGIDLEETSPEIPAQPARPAQGVIRHPIFGALPPMPAVAATPKTPAQYKAVREATNADRKDRVTILNNIASIEKSLYMAEGLSKETEADMKAMLKKLREELRGEEAAPVQIPVPTPVAPPAAGGGVRTGADTAKPTPAFRKALGQ